jgi:hypothetical protein
MPPHANRPDASPAFTIVIPTYGRPDALRCAVQSVLQQSRPDWLLLVIGDACGDETAAAMSTFLDDARIRYVNLPERCGEQALLNSAAMALATTDYIAFLNHDDLWLPQHLALADRRMREAAADFFIGRSAWTWGQPSADAGVPALECLSPEPRDPLHFFLSGIHYIEPASAWVITRELARRVGPWRPALELFRTPIQDWAMRAWRSGARLIGAEQVSCLKFENQWAKGSLERKYDTPAAPQIALTAVICDQIRLAQLQRQLQQLSNDPAAVGRGMQPELAATNEPELRRIVHALISPQMASYYLQTGLDAYAWCCAEAGLQRGWRWRMALRKRTGEEQLAQPSLASVLEHLTRALP